MSELYRSEPVAALRKDLAFALRAAAHFGLEEGVCNHFRAALPDERGLFLLNPQGLMWREVQADDIVIVGEDVPSAPNLRRPWQPKWKENASKRNCFLRRSKEFCKYAFPAIRI